MKTRHHFDPRKGEPPYWLRNDPRDLEAHRKMRRDHEQLYRGREQQRRQS